MREKKRECDYRMHADWYLYHVFAAISSCCGNPRSDWSLGLNARTFCLEVYPCALYYRAAIKLRKSYNITLMRTYVLVLDYHKYEV